MDILEDAWHKHEKQREDEVHLQEKCFGRPKTETNKLILFGLASKVGVMRAESTALEMHLKELVTKVEERERKLVLAEDALNKRKASLEREYTAKITDAEAAVRRLQVSAS